MTGKMIGTPRFAPRDEKVRRPPRFTRSRSMPDDFSSFLPFGEASIVLLAGLDRDRTRLLRCGYPFGGSIDEKRRVLGRLHATIGELMQPLEPTFPNWQGLYAG